MDKHTYLQHSHCNLDKGELLEHMVEAIHIPDTTDNPHWRYNQAFAEDNPQRVHNLKQAVDNCALEVDIQGNMDMVNTQVEKEALPRDARPGSQKRVRDSSFEDQYE